MATGKTLMPRKEVMLGQCFYIYLFVSSQLRGESRQVHVDLCRRQGHLDFAEAQDERERSWAKYKKPLVMTGFAAQAMCGKQSIGRQLGYSPMFVFLSVHETATLCFGSLYQEKNQKAPRLMSGNRAKGCQVF